MIDDWGRTPQPFAGADGGTIFPPAFQQVLKGLPAVNYSARDIIYRPRNVRAHRVYGYSPVQQVLMTVNIALRRQLWQLDYFTEGSIPDALIGVPQGWAPDQIKQFQDYWDTEFVGDLAKRRRAKFVPGEAATKVVQTKELYRREILPYIIQHMLPMDSLEIGGRIRCRLMKMRIVATSNRSKFSRSRRSTQWSA
ncbi:MAG TPA: hypothetical protein VGH13_12660 [Xanthobacteraceae bacterium]